MAITKDQTSLDVIFFNLHLKIFIKLIIVVIHKTLETDLFLFAQKRIMVTKPTIILENGGGGKIVL